MLNLVKATHVKKIKFTCTKCDAKLRVPTHLAGVSAPCPKCGTTITAPTDITQAVEDEPRRPSSGAGSVAATSPGIHQDSSHSHEASYKPMGKESATALADPPVGKSVKPAAATEVTVPRREATAPGNAPLPKADPVAGAESTAPAASLSSPAAELPKTTSSVAIPTPVTRPLQPRPITPPTATESAPNFFTPPPPVLPLSPVAPEGPNTQSDAPVSLPDSDPVVVEVSSFPVPAPDPVPAASVITRPIQVHSRPSDLPDFRSEISGSDSLPRLDVSLAGHDAGQVGGALSGEHTGPPVRTRVQLPQPGVETQKFNPDDFIVPATAPPASPPAPAGPTEEAPPDLDLFDPDDIADAVEEADTARFLNIPIPSDSAPIPLDDLDDISFDDLADPGGSEEPPDLSGSDFDEEEEYYGDLAGDEEIPPGLEAPAWSEEELAGVSVSAGHVEIPWNLQPGSVPDDVESRAAEASGSRGESVAPPESDPHDDFAFDEVPVNSLQEGNFGKLFSQQSAGAQGNAPREPAHATSVPIPPAPATSAPTSGLEGSSEPQGDVLHELFGKSQVHRDDPKKLSLTAVVMISSIIGAAAIAVLMVVFLWQFGGGLDPAESYKEGSLVEGEAEQAAAASTASPALVADAGTFPDEVPAVIDPVAISRESSAPSSADESPSPKQVPETAEAPALSIDERVQQIVNGTGGTPATSGSVIGQPSLDLDIGAANTPPIPVETPAPAAALDSSSAPVPAAGSATSVSGSAGEESSVGTARPAADTAKSANYNPPSSFAAPGPNDSPLLRTNDLIDAFLRAPDWQSRIKYTYHGESLRPAIEDYYKKWPDNKIDRYYLQLFQMEQSTELGGPYWVYLVSTSDADQGFPLIIRVEDGNLKVDWEIYSEFFDRHFVRFREGTMPRPSTFRVVIERVSDYYGTDREAFTNMDDYLVYQINPPYGDLNEFSEYAFVEKDSEIAKKLEGVVGLGEEPLAVIVTLDEKPFSHGVKHFVITEYLTEGWFR